MIVLVKDAKKFIQIHRCLWKSLNVLFHVDADGSELRGEIRVFKVGEIEGYLHVRGLIPDPPVLVKVLAILDIGCDQSLFPAAFGH